jgi:hypothetical protein
VSGLVAHCRPRDRDPGEQLTYPAHATMPESSVESTPDVGPTGPSRAVGPAGVERRRSEPAGRSRSRQWRSPRRFENTDTCSAKGRIPSAFGSPPSVAGGSRRTARREVLPPRRQPAPLRLEHDARGRRHAPVLSVGNARSQFFGRAVERASGDRHRRVAGSYLACVDATRVPTPRCP